MAVVFVGGEITSFSPNETLSGERTDNYDPAWARCSLRTIGAPGGPTMTGALFAAAVTNCWLHMDFSTTAGSRNTFITNLSLFDSGGTERIRLESNVMIPALRVMYNNGAGWVQAAADYGINHQSRQTLDLQVLCNTASGRIKLYNSGTLVLDSGVLNLSGIAQIHRLRFAGSAGLFPDTDVGCHASQVIVADEPTIGWKLATFVPTGNGANTAWTGGFGDVDEIIYNDGDFISSGTANDVETFTLTGPSLGTTQVKAVAVTTRVRRSASGPQNLQHALRVGGTNYFGATKALDVGFTPEITLWATDPATGIAWVPGDVPAIEAGVRSIA